MPLHVTSRTRRQTDASRVPSTLQVGTAVLAGLHQRGTLRKVEGWFPLSRRAGHGTRSLFTFAVAFLLAGRSWGLRPFAKEFRRALERIVAPVAGLRAVPTASSVSRALGDFTHVAVRACLDPLLTADLDVRRVLASPHVQHRDAHGRGWHVLDVDPTVEAFRQRGLPDDPELPAAVRLAPGVPGYTGHKRGEFRIRHIPIQHAGSGLWLGYRLDAAGGSVLPLLADVVRVGRRAVVDVQPDAQVVVRADGEFGSVGAMQAVLREGAAVLTRLSRYALLDRDEVVAMLAGATWLDVPSAGGGPARTAADLGLFTLYPRDGVAAAEDGAVEVRVVVTRFARNGAVDHGVLRDGYQLELFATTLPADAWPANDLVALYFGRGAMENRFAQEDREFGIDRTFSYHPPGQEWMSGIALFLWNVLLGRGVAANPLPPLPAAQAIRKTEALPPQPFVSTTEDGVAIADVTTPTARGTMQPTPAKTDEPEQPARTETPRELPGIALESDLHAELWAITRAAFSDLPSLPGWRLDDENMEVRCPNDKRLFAYSTDRQEYIGSRGVHVKNRLYIRTQATACDGCPVREACRSSDRPGVPKQVVRVVSEPVMVRATELVHALRKLRRPAKIRNAIKGRRERLAAATSDPTTKARPPMAPIPLLPTGILLPETPLFLPAQSRARARALLRGVTLHVHTTPSATQPTRGHPLLARDAADRQRCRQSWSQRAERWRGNPATLVVGGPHARLVLERFISDNTAGISP